MESVISIAVTLMVQVMDDDKEVNYTGKNG
jgi:hypothetical protein